MKRDYGSQLVALLSMMMLVGVVLIGCDNSLKVDNPFSPEADMRITSLAGAGNATEIRPTLSEDSQTQTTVAVFDDVIANVQIFNGVSVQLTGFVVDYLEEDGVTPATFAPGVPVPSLRGSLGNFLFGGTPAASNFTSLDPSVSATVAAGVLGGAVLNLDIVSNDIDTLLSGGDGTYIDGNERDTLIQCLLTIFGEDINGHSISARGRIAISSTRLLDEGS